MFKKWGVLLILLVLLTGAGFYIFFVPRTYTRQVSVPYTMLKTGEQLYNLKTVAKWYRPFAGAGASNQTNGSVLQSGDYSLEILQPSSVSAILKTGYKGRQKEFLFAATPDSGSMDASVLKLVYKSTLFNHWMDKGGLEHQAKESLEELKNYMEDTRRFYGYEIEQVTVTDTLFVFQSATVPLTEKREATKKLFEQLIDYADKKKLEYTGVRIFYFTPYANDKIMLFASIGVTHAAPVLPGEPYQYKRMPFGKNLLAATYQGPYADVTKVYTALENFKLDHKLSSMAIPFQKFLSEGFDFADDQVVQMKVYYPIF